MSALDTVFTATPDCVACEFGDGIAILDTASNRYFSLNAVGNFVWQQLSSPLTIDQIVTRVSVHYDVDRLQCADDVRKLIGDLAAQDLIRS